MQKAESTNDDAAFDRFSYDFISKRAKPFVLSVHKFHDCFTFKMSPHYVYDVCDAVASEWSIESTTDSFHEHKESLLSSGADDSSKWICVDFVKQSIDSNVSDEDKGKGKDGGNRLLRQIQSLVRDGSGNAINLNRRGWFIVDFERRRIYTNDQMFSKVLVHWYLEFYSLKMIAFLVLKNLPFLIVHIVDKYSQLKADYADSSTGAVDAESLYKMFLVWDWDET